MDEISNIEAEVHSEVCWVVDKIKKLYILTPKDEYVNFNYSKNELGTTPPVRDAQEKVLEALEHAGAIKLHNRTFNSIFESLQYSTHLRSNVTPSGYLIDVIQNSFFEVDEKLSNGERLLLLPKKNIESDIYPNDLSWSEITITFQNFHDVQIQFRDAVFKKTYEDMGFKDGRDKKPNKWWELLHKFSENQGELPSIERYQKKALVRHLKKHFGINDDPFEDVKTAKKHRLKFRILPESCAQGLLREI